MPDLRISVCIPTIPPRGALLNRAIESVTRQTLAPDAIHVAVDHYRMGHGPCRTRAIAAASTEWVAFLDDDDEMYPQHLEHLAAVALELNADVVYPWFDVIGGTDPFPQFEGRPWNTLDVHLFPVTVLMRREVIMAAGGFTGPHGDGGTAGGQDWASWKRVFALGAKIVHLSERTWAWHHDSGNTAGHPARW